MFSFLKLSQSHLWPTISRSVRLGVEPHLGLMTRYFLFDIYCFVDVERPLWREVGSVICISHLNCFSSVILLLGFASYFHELSNLTLTSHSNCSETTWQIYIIFGIGELLLSKLNFCFLSVKYDLLLHTTYKYWETVSVSCHMDNEHWSALWFQ
jgi:hypothetical protein